MSELLILNPTPIQWIRNSLQAIDTKEVPVSNDIAIFSRQLSLPHENPADRFIAATAVYYVLTLVTVDENLLNAPGLKILN